MLLLVALCLTACTTDPPPPSTRPKPPLTPPASQLDQPEGDPCMDACRRRNMARAVDAATIDADCERACTKAPDPLEGDELNAPSDL